MAGTTTFLPFIPEHSDDATAIFEHTQVLSPSFPKRSLHIKLFTEVKNAAVLYDYLFNNSAHNSSLKNCICIFVNPACIVSILHIVHAMHRALFNEITHQLRTKSLQTELLFCLSGSANISESLQLFGINKNLTELLLVTLDTTPQQMQQLEELIKGTAATLNKLPQYMDVNLIKKHLNCLDDEMALPGGLEGAMLSRIATKGL
ncbi:kinase binding protein cgi-121 protein [Cardiosporidium cionae]|uniref:Kinase binding protein cgi-121 protein n=1 Tax=Cardiosporidium cionae TaxID=476202 RepID=A0ABQ7J5E5_9APIC|nr:kinase binding protein cgi-121 protein [Cardiosporidium cionae]|eukprot:KAF8819165.1 kinase binding protein cgi-121 protein [Cardiosporidium cionae]